MKYRSKPKRGSDKRRFSKTASKVNKKNYSPGSMRGGIRL